MATITLTEADFQATVTAPGMVLVDFWAEWCGPCKRFGPVFEAVSQEHPDAVFAKVDTEAEQDLAAGLEISSIPTLMVFKDGYLVFREAGALSQAQLTQLVQQVSELDVQAALAEAAAESAADQS